MYDAIVVGARCAGSPTAMLLARKGYNVLLLDRATFPSDTLSTQVIWPPGLARLKRWGLLDRVVNTGCPVIDKPLAFDFGPVVLSGTPSAYEGIREAYAPRRTLLDKILIDAAREAGAEVRENFSVREVTFDGDRVTGIQGQTHDGEMVSEEARIVIGADGLHSLVARAVSPTSYNEKPTVGCYYYSYWSGQLASGMSAWIREGGAAVAIPTNDATLIIAARPIAEFHDFRADIEGNFFRTIDEIAPALGEKMRDAEQVERFSGTGDVPAYFRKPYGSGWTLVGDAAYHKDPTTAQGISDAFRDAENLAEGLDSVFSGSRPFDDAMSDYETTRNETVTPLYELTWQLATLQPPPPEMQQLMGALPGNQEQTDRFFGMVCGTIPVPDFFAPENVRRIMAAV